MADLRDLLLKQGAMIEQLLARDKARPSCGFF
jgi:hypothetical protein